MSLESKLKELLHNYVQNLDRKQRRIFNSSLKKYPYIMFFPEIEKYNNDIENPLLQIGFTKSTLKINKGSGQKAFSFLETEDNSDDVYYITSGLAYIFDEAIYVSTADVEEVFISTAPLDIAINAEALYKANPYSFVYSLTEFFVIQTLPYDVGEDIEKLVSTIQEINVEVIYEDIHILSNSKRKHGRVTERVKFNNECIGFFSLSGLDVSSVKTFVIDENKWSEMMHFVFDKINLKELMDKTYSVLNPNEDCDINFGVPTVTGYIFDQNNSSGDVL